MKSLAAIRQFLIISAVVGIVLPFFISLCVFGTTLQSFVAGGQPTPGYWSGAPTAAPTPVPSPVRVWTGNAFSAGGGTLFIVWSVLGACAGEALALRRSRGQLNPTPSAIMGAAAGSLIFIAIALCGLLK